MTESRRLIRAQRPTPGAVRVETIDGETCLFAADPWRLPWAGQSYDPLAWSRPRLWQVLADLDLDDADACAQVASKWGFLLRPVAFRPRGGGAPTAETPQYQHERLDDWRAALTPFQVAAGLLSAWTRGDWTDVSLRIFPTKGGSVRGWIAVADPPDHAAAGPSYGVVGPLPSEPTREHAARLIHSELATKGLQDHTAVADDAEEGPRVVILSLLGAAWLSMVEDRVKGISYTRCVRCGEPVLVLGADARSKRAEYCGPPCRAAAHKARQRARKKSKKKTTRKASKRRAR